MKIWLLLITCVACGVGDMSSERRDSQSNTCPAAGTAKGNDGKQTETNTACTIEMAEGEIMLSDVQENELDFMTTETFKPQIALRIPQILQKRLDYLNTMVKKPMLWAAKHSSKSAMEGNLNDGFPKMYAEGAGNDDHLAVSPRVNTSGGQSYYPIVWVAGSDASIQSFDFSYAKMTYDVIDYFANPKCPATITGDNKPAYVSVRFPNGNEIKLSPPHQHPMISLELSFWMGRDNNLKMAYYEVVSSKAWKFATLAECGVRMPEHDYECEYDITDDGYACK